MIQKKREEVEFDQRYNLLLPCKSEVASQIRILHLPDRSFRWLDRQYHMSGIMPNVWDPRNYEVGTRPARSSWSFLDCAAPEKVAGSKMTTDVER